MFLTCASSALRRGEAEAKITLRPLTEFNAGKSNGNGIRGRGPAGPLGVLGDFGG